MPSFVIKTAAGADATPGAVADAIAVPELLPRSCKLKQVKARRDRSPDTRLLYRWQRTRSEMVLDLRRMICSEII